MRIIIYDYFTALHEKQAKIMENDVETRCTSGQSLVILNQLGDTKTWPFEMVSELNLGTAETLKIFGPERPIKLSNKGVKTTHLENALSYSLVHEHQITHSFQKNRYWKKYIFFFKICIRFEIRS